MRPFAVIRLAIASLVAASLFVFSAPPEAHVRAAEIELRLGGEGSTRWDIGSIKPGDTGTQTVTLHNAGTRNGYVAIWLSDVISIQGTAGRPGKLTDYLTLNVFEPNLETNVALPVVMADFPQSSSGAHYIRISSLLAGETRTLVWTWLLPAATGNEIQGNGVSFSVNYMLEELPPAPVGGGGGGGGSIPEEPPAITPPPPPPPVKILQVDLLGSSGTVELAPDGTLSRPLVISDPQKGFTLALDSGSRVYGPDNEELGRIELEVLDAGAAQIPVPGNIVIISPVYDIKGFTRGGEPSRIIFDPFALITINYNRSRLPENSLPPYIINYDSELGLTRLEYPPGAVIEIGKALGVAFHTSLFAVAAEVASPPPPLPPDFSVSNLVISPRAARTGQPVSVSVDIANSGQAGGSYEVHLIVDGIIRAIKEVSVQPGTVSTVRFEVSNLSTGLHQVQVAGLSGQFRILGAAVTIPGTSVNWPLVDLIVAGVVIVGLIFAFVLIRRARRKLPASASPSAG